MTTPLGLGDPFPKKTIAEVRIDREPLLLELLTCSYDEDWNRFREALVRNKRLGFPFDGDLYYQ